MRRRGNRQRTVQEAAYASSSTMDDLWSSKSILGFPVIERVRPVTYPDPPLWTAGKKMFQQER
ncbi:MAG: hypothetical protein GXP63_07335 [DPANN group archaeon]|nr:hypothetical protein [DPANN group archaeon]